MSTSSTNSSLRLIMLLIFLTCVLQITVFNLYSDINGGHPLLHPQTRRSSARQHLNVVKTPENITDVIVYLAQFKDHSTYGVQYDAHHNAITGISKLNSSLELLHKNYVNHFPSCHVIIFHDATDVPSDEARAILSKNRPQLQFKQLDGKWWTLPYGLKEKDRFKWKRTGFSVGYRHMMRWFAILIWPYLDQEGYTHVMVSAASLFNFILFLLQIFQHLF